MSTVCLSVCVSLFYVLLAASDDQSQSTTNSHRIQHLSVSVHQQLLSAQPAALRLAQPVAHLRQLSEPSTLGTPIKL